MTKLKRFQNYFHKVDKSKLKFIEGWTPKKEYVKNTMNLFFDEIYQEKCFTKSQLDELEDWLHDISKKRKKVVYTDLPNKKPLKTEAVKFNNQIILKECLNLLKYIVDYHNAYMLRTENEELLKNTIFDISYDKRKMQQRLNKYSKIANNLRLNKNDRGLYILLKNVLNLLVNENYEKRAKYYIYSIALNYTCINWDNLYNLDEKDIKIRRTIDKVIDYFMYEKYSENKIKHSLMILVYTYLTKRMLFNEDDSLNLTNRLCNDILYDLDEKEYTKAELSRNIYLHSVFNYLPIFSYYNKKNKPTYTKEEEKKVAHTIKKQAIMLNKNFKAIDINKYIDIFKNAHIEYINTELTYLYKTKNEKS